MIKSWIRNNSVILIAGIIFAIYNLFIHTNSMDDFAMYEGLLELTPLSTWLEWRYDTWTSRILIDGVIVMLVEWNSWIFRILNWFVWMLLIWSMVKLLKISENKMLQSILVILFLIYPFCTMQSAGWCATSINYLWPASLGAFSMCSIVDNINKEKIRIKNILTNAILIVATIFAGNQEQMCAILCTVFGLAVAYQIKGKCLRQNVIVSVQFFLSILQLIYIMTCPGNAVRKIQEIDRWMPEYTELTFIDKISIGITDTVNGLFVSNASILFLILCFVVATIIAVRGTNQILRRIAWIPLFMATSVKIFPATAKGIWTEVESIFSGMKLIKQSEWSSIAPNEVIGNIIYFIIGIILLIAIVYAFEKTEDKILYVCLLASGLITRIVIGFSPSIYVSGSRTFLFLWMIIIFVTVKLLALYEKDMGSRKMKLLQGVLVCIACFSFFNTIGGLLVR